MELRVFMVLLAIPSLEVCNLDMIWSFLSPLPKLCSRFIKFYLDSSRHLLKYDYISLNVVRVPNYGGYLPFYFYFISILV